MRQNDIWRILSSGNERARPCTDHRSMAEIDLLANMPASTPGLQIRSALPLVAGFASKRKVVSEIPWPRRGGNFGEATKRADAYGQFYMPALLDAPLPGWDVVLSAEHGYTPARRRLRRGSKMRSCPAGTGGVSPETVRVVGARDTSATGWSGYRKCRGINDLRMFCPRAGGGVEVGIAFYASIESRASRKDGPKLMIRQHTG